MTVKKDLRQKRKAQIISAAARVFSKTGFSKTVMTDIAIEAQIGKGTIYEYFKSKEDLFFAVFEWFSQKSADLSLELVSKAGGRASRKIYRLNHALMDFWFQIKDLYTLVMEFWAASSTSEMRGRFKEAFQLAYRDYRRMVAALIQEGIDQKEFQADVNPEAVAAALVGAWDALLLQAWFDESFDPVATSNHFVNILVRGLKTGPNTNMGDGETES